MTWVKAFGAGFLATLLFHQGLIAALHAAGVLPSGAWSMAPTAPFGVPQVISLAFWGGIWGIVLWWFVRHHRGAARGWLAFAFGAIAPTAVAFLAVFPLKGIEVQLVMLPFGLLLNGVWGLGTLLLMLALERGAGTPEPRMNTDEHR